MRTFKTTNSVSRELSLYAPDAAPQPAKTSEVVEKCTFKRPSSREGRVLAERTTLPEENATRQVKTAR
jgi:aspartate carbamoyltransferase regulatory subunit